MQRYGMTIGLKPEQQETYIKLHEAVWTEVLAILKKHHVSNYSIYLFDNQLFGYLEYHGDDFAKDMADIANYPMTQKWWALTEPCQLPLQPTSSQWWTMMDEVFHLD